MSEQELILIKEIGVLRQQVEDQKELIFHYKRFKSLLRDNRKNFIYLSNSHNENVSGRMKKLLEDDRLIRVNHPQAQKYRDEE